MKDNACKVTIEDSETSITVLSSDKDLPRVTNIFIAVEMAKAAKVAADKAKSNYFNKDDESSPVEFKKYDKPIEIPRPGFRKRLPNQVDVSELDVKDAVTENALVRCPACGQSSIIAVQHDGELYEFMAKRNNEFKHIVTCNSTDEMHDMAYRRVDRTKIPDYYNDINNIRSFEDNDVVINNDTQICCPICGSVENFNEWKNAWQNPLLYFEYEHPCEWCGGETTVLKADESGEVVYKCEICGHEFKE